MTSDPNGGTPFSGHSVRFDLVITFTDDLTGFQDETRTSVQVTRLLPFSQLDEAGLTRLFEGVTKDLLSAVSQRLKPRPL